ncbi:type II toxin-antitoxin system RelE/ParE family toxin [Mesorhizobium australicum]|uniref:type II toxin-antitoxin system RelE/ParE family toxin n=1 Tax=Mesorhizobium australicum TaxID=536018 RepID=UPI000A1CD807|nr:type II toxin-antitoxin system RelE/ParE family toxin [Mesorhizobium australicum]
MASIVWRDRAVRHLNEIEEYIRARSPNAAARYISELRIAVASLAEFPDKGRRFDSKRRILVFRNHVILMSSTRNRIASSWRTSSMEDATFQT